MAGTLMLDYEAISTSATNLQAEGDAMSECINKITNIVNGLLKCYTNVVTVVANKI